MNKVAKNKSIVRSNEVVGAKVINFDNQNLGKIHDIVLDKLTGHVKYSVLASGTFLGLGGKFFAIPWQLLRYNPQHEAYVLNVKKEDLERAPGFDKDRWPVFSDESCHSINKYYSGF